MGSFQNRLLVNEQLDNLDLKGPELIRTLKSLALTNALFGTHAQINSAVLDHLKHISKNKPWHIVDLGCGGGDCIRRLNIYLKKQGYQNIKFTGIDGNRNSITFAKQKQFENVDFKVLDLSKLDFKLPHCDMVICSHFAYHFSDSEFANFINHLHGQNSPVILLSELQRQKLAYQLFKIAGFFLPLSQMAKRDGRIAIKRSFTLDEIIPLCTTTHYSNIEVLKKPWFRMLIKLS